MGISLPPEVRELMDRFNKDIGFAYGPMVVHVYKEANRYFEPTANWIERQIKFMERQKPRRNICNFVLTESLEVDGREPWQVKLCYRWVNNEPLRELHPSDG